MEIQTSAGARDRKLPMPETTLAMLEAMTLEIQINPLFRDCLPPLSEDEAAQLEANLLADGCRVPLVVWAGTSPPTLVDGHNRYGVCLKHGLPFCVELRNFDDEDSVRAWLINEHLGRRSFLPEAAAYARGLKYNAVKRQVGRPEKWGQNVPITTAEGMASSVQVSARTIKRHARFASALDRVAGIVPDAGEVKKAALVRDRKTVEKGQSQKPALNMRAVVALDDLIRDGDEAGAKARLDKILKEGKSLRQVENELAAEAIRQEPPPLPEGPFRVVVIDPPWRYDSRENDATHRAANPYPSMSVEEIIKLPVQAILHEDCVVWLWTTNAHIWHVPDILNAWGLTPKTILTWHKDRMGTGDWLRGQTEHCVLAVQGRPTITLTNQTTVIKGPLREHSRKPEEFYALVESLCPAPDGGRVELFSRTERQGWATHGNQTGSF